MNKGLLLGIDAGTSAVKALAMDETGRVHASAVRGYPLYTPRPGWAEQDPADWLRATAGALGEVLGRIDKSRLIGVSFSGQMSGLVALDSGMNVIRPAMLWCDQRTSLQCGYLTMAAGGARKYIEYTNNPLVTGNTAGKLIWLKQNEPDSFARMKLFLCPKDHIRFLLCGAPGMDASDASGTGFFDTKNRKWSRDLIDIAGLDMSVFPEVHESTELAGYVTRRAAALTGLPEGLPVYYGGGDTTVQAAGSGLMTPGALGVSVGTSGNVMMCLDSCPDNPGGALQIYCANEPGKYVAFGCTLSAGGALRWYSDALCGHAARKAARTGRNVYDVLSAEAQASPPGANGVIFAPYLTGERCPHTDPNARAVFYGMSLGTSRADMTRAVMEGVAFSMKQAADVIGRVASFDSLLMSGGGSASPLWRQIFADVFGCTVITMSAADEGGAYGAAMIAGVGAGLWKDLAAATGILRVESRTLPAPENAEAYRRAAAVYGGIYPALKDLFSRGADLGM